MRVHASLKKDWIKDFYPEIKIAVALPLMYVINLRPLFLLISGVRPMNYQQK